MKKFTHTDNIHLTAEGYKKLADSVIAAAQSMTSRPVHVPVVTKGIEKVHTLWRTHRPPLYPIPTVYLLGRSVGAPEGVGGGGRGEESSSISRLLKNSGAPSALKQIVHKSSSLYTLFHSVIYNSVIHTYKLSTPNPFSKAFV